MTREFIVSHANCRADLGLRACSALTLGYFLGTGVLCWGMNVLAETLCLQTNGTRRPGEQGATVWT